MPLRNNIQLLTAWHIVDIVKAYVLLYLNIHWLIFTTELICGVWHLVCTHISTCIWTFFINLIC